MHSDIQESIKQSIARWGRRFSGNAEKLVRGVVKFSNFNPPSLSVLRIERRPFFASDENFSSAATMALHNDRGLSPFENMASLCSATVSPLCAQCQVSLSPDVDQTPALVPNAFATLFALRHFYSTCSINSRNFRSTFAIILHLNELSFRVSRKYSSSVCSCNV